LIAERFEIEHLAGSGGMGMVFRAYDRQSGQPVALKMLPPAPRSQDTERLMREAQMLAELRHPGISAYVAHGRTVQGQIFLAMEWLEGEDLGQRLRRQGLSLGECLTLVQVAAATLGAVHRRGIVHRDIKPGNLFLRNGQVERVTLLDFGIARNGITRGSVTRTGEVVGTLHYIAPEQARGDRQVGPSADIFALGCVLYECLVGSPPFAGGHVAVVLTRILCEEVPPLGRARPDLPEALEYVVGRMLAKRPEDRYADGDALLEAVNQMLRTFEQAPADENYAPGARIVPPPAPGLMAEQQLVSVVLAVPRGPVDEAVAQIESADSDLLEMRRVELAERLAALGARVVPLASGASVVTLAQAGETARDQALQAARAACLLKDQEPETIVVVATGRGVLEGPQPVGEVVERAVRLVAHGEAEDVVCVDELTAGLLDGQFEMRRVDSRSHASMGPDAGEVRGERRPAGRDGSTPVNGAPEGAEVGCYALVRERSPGDPTRRLLGRPTPCVGREQELQLLSMVYHGCVEEGAARAVVMVAPAGMGKSRLRHEFVRRLQEEGEEMAVLLGRGDPMQAGAAYGLLGGALRRWCGVDEPAMDLGRRRELFAQAVGRRVTGVERQRVVEFLGELCGLAYPDEHSPRLRAARQEPRLMSHQIAEALVLLLRAECAVQPVILVLEDLQWGDAATVRLVDVALRELDEQPLFVLALARPEIHKIFPQLWESRSLQELRLSELGRRASERLVREVLGERTLPAVVARVVAQAGGNALYLEELIRAVAEGAGEELPETVLAMLQSRFLRLEPEARRVLRAASIFGETFWRGGVLELLGAESRDEHDIDRWLAILVEAEILVRYGVSRFVEETQLGFRHGLLRDAAYSLLGEEDRQLGHLLAARYLERQGESDPLLLGEHYRLGGELDRAVFFFAWAAQRAFEAGDLAGALDRAERGIACGASGEMLGVLRGVEAWAHVRSKNLTLACEVGAAGLELLPPGSVEWYQVIGALLAAAGIRGQRETLLNVLQRLLTVEPLPGTAAAFAEPAMVAVFMLGMAGMHREATAFLARLCAVGATLGESDARGQGLVHLATVWHRLLVTGDPGEHAAAAVAAKAALGAAGDRYLLGAAEVQWAVSQAHLGDTEESMRAFRVGLELLDQLKEHQLLLMGQAYLALSLSRWGTQHREEARAIGEAVILKSPEPNLWSGIGHTALGETLLGEGRPAAAEEEARRALAILESAPAGRPPALAVLIDALRLQGRLAEARAVADEGMALLAALGGSAWMDVRLELAVAEALQAAGAEEAAREAGLALCRKIRQRAIRLADERARARYLAVVPENVRALRLWPDPDG
jgi:tetratricopeptide (TPR) repeat protein